MRSPLSSLVAILIFAALLVTVSTQETDNITFSACPLIGTYYPPPTISKSSRAFSQLASTFTDVFDELIKDGGSEKYGSIMPNTTSFSVVLFGGSDSLREDPIFFEYHYTSPMDQSVTGKNLTASTKFPVGDVTMVFTVYAWLVDKGEQWEESITKYLPELAGIKGPFTVPWEDVTIGALAGQMSGLSRQCELPSTFPSFRPMLTTRPSTIMRHWRALRLER